MFVYFLMYSSHYINGTFRYMSQVVHDVQQQYLMKQARSNMAADTTYIIFDFKQKFWKKGMLWFGMGAYVKPADLSLDKDAAHDELPKNKELDEELEEELEKELEEELEEEFEEELEEELKEELEEEFEEELEEELQEELQEELEYELGAILSSILFMVQDMATDCCLFQVLCHFLWFSWL